MAIWKPEQKSFSMLRASYQSQPFVITDCPKQALFCIESGVSAIVFIHDSSCQRDGSWFRKYLKL